MLVWFHDRRQLACSGSPVVLGDFLSFVEDGKVVGEMELASTKRKQGAESFAAF